MAKVDDIVLYGGQGVCKITELTTRAFKSEITEYFVLCPIYDKNSKVFVPIHNESLTRKMRNLLTKEELSDILKSKPDGDELWMNNDNERKEQFKQIINNCDRKVLMKLIKTLYYQQELQKLAGKKLHMPDERILKEVEKIIFDEYAFVLNISHDEVPIMIKEQMKTEIAQ